MTSPKIPKTRLVKSTRRVGIKEFMAGLEERTGLSRYSPEFVDALSKVSGKLRVEGHAVFVKMRDMPMFGENKAQWFFQCQCGTLSRHLYSPEGLPYMCRECHGIRHTTGNSGGFGTEVIDRLHEMGQISKSKSNVSEAVARLSELRRMIRSSLLKTSELSNINRYLEKNARRRN